MEADGPSSGVAQDQGGGHSPQEGVIRDGGAAGHADEGRKRLIQQQLALLLHAHKCKRKRQCRVNHCRTIKTVLAHMATCRKGSECPVTYCASSRHILLHYKTCKNSDCFFCSFVRQRN
ncbi:histone acetyltransferase p300-like [Drosophila subpulchrella]|uniref:histone acetyltransferase p300-like n=1 Tax=Drosophila subpulchrella TaxID=1486046 RepID=UPI0018A175E6|nr:histone acetyltransferase p300-like [Drosophila subpulchrella]